MRRKFWISAVLAVAVLNLLDAFITIHAVGRGAEEANPLMRYALQNGFFLQVKFLVSLSICLCCVKIDSLLVKVVISIILLIYFFINVNHIILLQLL